MRPEKDEASEQQVYEVRYELYKDMRRKDKRVKKERKNYCKCNNFRKKIYLCQKFPARSINVRLK